MYKVSIITPIIKNDLKFLHDCVGSINNQIYKDIEWVVVVNEDIGILDILSDYKDDLSINVINLHKDVSIGEARNIGIEESKGEYIYFLDVDDFITKHNIYCLLETASIDNSDVVIGKIKNITTKHEIDHTYEFLMDRVLESRNKNSQEAKLSQLNNKCLNILFKKSFILNNNIRFSNDLNLLYDLAFTTKSYNYSNKNAYDKDAIYLKRFRNDQIRYASLTTRHKDEFKNEVPIAYIDVISSVENNTELISKLSKDVYSKYKNLLRDIYESDDIKTKETLENWSKLFNLLDVDSIINKKSIKNNFKIRELDAIKNKKFASAINMAKSRIRFNEINKGYIKKGSKKRRSIYKDFLVKLPVKKNYIMYESFLGKNMSDSPKYIYNYMNETYKNKYKHI